MIDIYSPEKGTTCVVRQGFTDFCENVFTPGEMLTFDI
jgi:hypothetical protein